MLASDLEVSIPMVHRDMSVSVAARLIAGGHLPALVAADPDGAPRALVSSADILASLDLAPEAGEPTIGDILDGGSALSIPVVTAGATLAELSTAMKAGGADIAFVADSSDGLRFVLRADLIAAILEQAGDDSTS